jgi:hypothetical protein
MSIIRVDLSGEGSKRVGDVVLNFVFIGFGVLEWVLVAYVIDLIVRSI